MTLQRIATLVALSVSIAACASSAVEEDTGEVAPMDTATTDTGMVRTDTANVPPTPSRADSAAYPAPTPSPMPTDTAKTDTTTTPTFPTDTSANQPSTGARWTATLSATPAAMTDTTAGAGQVSGTATVTAGMGADQTSAEITVSGLAGGNTYPWHVHSGSCATGGPIVGPPDAYTPLTVSASGSADAKAQIPIATPTSGQYHVNVHKSQAEMNVIIACGDLTSGQ
jgi:hypothetical protein